MSITNTTPNLGLPLPYVDNTLLFDVDRLIASLTMLDAAVAARATTAAMNAAVISAINDLVGGAPAALNTLKELADAINDDANFAASVTSALAGKAPISHTHPQSDIIGLVDALAAKLGAAPATASNLGGVKVGAGLSVTVDGILSLTNPNAGNGLFSQVFLTAATNGQTVFTPAGGYTVGAFEVFLNGVLLNGAGDDYTASNGTTITLTTGINTTDTLLLRKWALFSVSNAVSKAGDTMAGAFNEAKAASVASASTIDLDNVAGNLVHVTGTTTINTITLAAGAARDIIFDGVLTLTKSANLDLPSISDITTVAGARARVRGDGSGKVIVMDYATPNAVFVNNLQAFTAATLLNQFFGVL